MGCSSSSAQTVDQEKRPGTKPEESNGDTLAVKNGIIAEDSKTIEDQMQLPVQTALPDDLQPGTGDETEAVLVALEAQEDLGSGEDLLAEPQLEPAACEDPAQEAITFAPAEDSGEPIAAVAVVEAVPPVEEEASVQTVQEEAPPVVKVLVEATEEAPAVKSVEGVKAEVPDVAEEVVPEPSVEPVVSELVVAPEAVQEALAEAVEAPVEVVAEVPDLAVAEAPVEAAAEAPVEAAAEAPVEAAAEAPVEVAAEAPVEAAAEAPVEAAAEAPVEAAAEAPIEVAAEAPVEASSEAPAEAAAEPTAEEAAPVEVEALTDNSAPETTSENAPNESSAPALVSVSVEPAAPAEPSVLEEAVEPVIDTAIAAASVPEMPPLSPVTVSAGADPHPATEVATEAPTAPAETTLPAEVTSALATEVEPAAELIQNAEVAAPAPSVSETQTEEVPEAPSGSVTSEPAADSAVPLGPPEPSSDVASANEASPDAASEKAKKED